MQRFASELKLDLPPCTRLHTAPMLEGWCRAGRSRRAIAVPHSPQRQP